MLHELNCSRRCSKRGSCETKILLECVPFKGLKARCVSPRYQTQPVGVGSAPQLPGDAPHAALILRLRDSARAEGGIQFLCCARQNTNHRACKHVRSAFANDGPWNWRKNLFVFLCQSFGSALLVLICNWSLGCRNCCDDCRRPRRTCSRRLMIEVCAVPARIISMIESLLPVAV